LNEKFTLDIIASCLFGIETNSLDNQNTTLISHLTAIFSVNLANLFILVLCMSNIRIRNLNSSIVVFLII